LCEHGLAPEKASEHRVSLERNERNFLFLKVYEIDPLLCRFCGTEMKIISFITEYPVIKKILTHINFESQQPEPLAHSPPLFQDTVYVPF